MEDNAFIDSLFDDSEEPKVPGEFDDVSDDELIQSLEKLSSLGENYNLLEVTAELAKRGHEKYMEMLLSTEGNCNDDCGFSEDVNTLSSFKRDSNLDNTIKFFFLTESANSLDSFSFDSYSDQKDFNSNFHNDWIGLNQNALNAIKKHDAEIAAQRQAEEAERSRKLHIEKVFKEAANGGVIPELITDGGWKNSGTVCKYEHQDDKRFKKLSDFLTIHGTCKYGTITKSGRGVVWDKNGNRISVNIPSVQPYMVIDDKNEPCFVAPDNIRGVTDMKANNDIQCCWGYVGCNNDHETYKERNDDLKELTDSLNRGTNSVSLDGDFYTFVTKEQYGSNNNKYMIAMNKARDLYGGPLSAFATNGAIVVCGRRGVYYENLPVNIAYRLQSLRWIPRDIKFTNSGLYLITNEDCECVYMLTDSLTDEQRAELKRQEEQKRQEEEKRKAEEAKRKAEEAAKRKARAEEKRRKEEEARLAEEEAIRIAEESSLWGRLKKLF